MSSLWKDLLGSVKPLVSEILRDERVEDGGGNGIAAEQNQCRVNVWRNLRNWQHTLDDFFFKKKALSAKHDLLMQDLAHLLQRAGGSEFDAQICLAHLQQQL